jgi:hypothetical protein
LALARIAGASRCDSFGQDPVDAADPLIHVHFPVEPSDFVNAAHKNYSTDVTVEEAQGFLVKLAYAFIDGRMRAGLKHGQFARFDAGGKIGDEDKRLTSTLPLIVQTFVK